MVYIYYLYLIIIISFTFSYIFSSIANIFLAMKCFLMDKIESNTWILLESLTVS